MRVYVAAESTDLRKSFDGLSSLVEQRFGADPLLCVVVRYVARRPSAGGLVGPFTLVAEGCDTFSSDLLQYLAERAVRGASVGELRYACHKAPVGSVLRLRRNQFGAEMESHHGRYVAGRSTATAVKRASPYS
ncbi:IS66 family insertion sequence element accessory protein TnpB [Sorangium sp. So ce1151]|uniref:IS66 family insertion sequence element accessory protein TnpB n=1 Tax=Sorangium sp. So ce1151 TaxID=3133332 RepID=UPI003F642DC0